MTHACSTSTAALILLGIAYVHERASALPVSFGVTVASPGSVSLVTTADGTEEAAFNITNQGVIQITGGAYSIPAYTKAKVTARETAMSFAGVDTLNKLVLGMLNATQRSAVEDYQRTHASADVSIWSMFGDGGSSSSAQIHSTMQAMGLTQAQIATIAAQLSHLASQMSQVSVELDVDNSENGYPACGFLQVYTISGWVSGSQPFTMLANVPQAVNLPASAACDAPRTKFCCSWDRATCAKSNSYCNGSRLNCEGSAHGKCNGHWIPKPAQR